MNNELLMALNILEQVKKECKKVKPDMMFD